MRTSLLGLVVAVGAVVLVGEARGQDVGPVGEISAETIESGSAVALWHLLEARRVMLAMDMPETTANAQLLLDWLLDQPTDEIRLKDISRLGPNRLREKAKRDPAIASLIDAGWARQDKTAGGISILQLNPKARAGR